MYPMSLSMLKVIVLEMILDDLILIRERQAGPRWRKWDNNDRNGVL
jgi:hypothetical protein